MRKALIVGIDYYQKINPLFGCVNDAYSVKSVLERHSDGTKNFDVNLVAANGESSVVIRKDLKTNIEELFKDKCEIALFYYAGHGHIENTGGYLITSECSHGDDGLSLNEVLQIANQSPATNKIIILDSCNSGIAGNYSSTPDTTALSDGMTILTASSSTQYAAEIDGAGVFTTLLVDALTGSASNLTGDITPGSIYAHIDQSLGWWQQRPIFKTNVSGFTTLRKVQPPISMEDLKKITILFDTKGSSFALNPSFEPESGVVIEENAEKFSILQKYNRINLVVPVGAPHMYHAAMESKSCKLTVLGEHYWSLVKNDRI
jgi:hypothetical protein